MKLSQFVEQTIVEIIEGVSNAQKKAGGFAAEVNPRAGTLHCQNVEFDVEVSTSESEGINGGIGIFAGPIALGTKGKKTESGSSIGRIKFNVPIKFSYSSENE